MQEKMTTEEMTRMMGRFISNEAVVGSAYGYVVATNLVSALRDAGFALVPTDETQWERGIDAAAQHYWFAGDEGRSQLRLVISAFMKAVGEK